MNVATLIDKLQSFPKSTEVRFGFLDEQDADGTPTYSIDDVELIISDQHFALISTNEERKNG